LTVTHDTVRDGPATQASDGTLDAVLAGELDALSRAGLRRTLRPVHGRSGTQVVVDGHAATDFSSNDYLGLASDPRVAAAAVAALAGDAIGAAAARLISGDHPRHESLERDIARYKQTDAALLFASGYLANIGAIPALVGPRDAIYADALNHASLIDGCRLSRAEIRVMPHADVEAFGAALAADRGRFRRRLIVVDGVFSMDGDVAPLDRLVALAREHGAWTYVDDAHGTGVLGAHGRGAAEHCGVEGAVDVTMGTLGKALGVAGAYVAGSRQLIDYLTNRARGFVFTTGTPPALAAAAAAALRIARAEPERRDRLRAVARRLREGLAALGYLCPGLRDGHIIPVAIGEAGETVRVGAALSARGYLVGAVRPPTVPLGTSRLRITASAAHTDGHIDGLLEALAVTLPMDRA
jgi:8-amino-7-oxononanoate synthase